MLQNTNTLAQSVRGIYLKYNRNFSLHLSIKDLQKDEIDLSTIFDDATLNEYISLYKSLEEEERGKEEDSTLINFTDSHDFSVANEQKKYCKNRVIEELQNLLRNRKSTGQISTRILSIGTGDGATAKRYSKLLDLQREDIVVGIDLHEKYLADARKNVPGMVTIEFDLNELSQSNQFPLEGNSFDFIECSMTAHHMERFDILIEEVARLLCTGGTFFYVDLIDKTVPEDDMVFETDHDYPEYHGVEFYRSHQQIASAVSERLDLRLYRRIGPGYILLSAVKN